MYRVTITAPLWAIKKGIAEVGEEQSELFETEEEAREFAKTGRVITFTDVDAYNDSEMYVKGWA